MANICFLNIYNSITTHKNQTEEEENQVSLVTEQQT